MLVGFHYAFTNLGLETNKDKTNIIFILIAGLVCIAMAILW
ncbi:hypothetical protein LLB_3569 [Legionella longbeachae D-4968]|nr:hypothetical protein LLB_3569 [Legionella longbeachae D-4968]